MTGIHQRLLDKLADGNDLNVIWRWINALFVRKDGKKVLSDNNYTDADKAKVDTAYAEDDLASDAEVYEMLNDIFGGEE